MRQSKEDPSVPDLGLILTHRFEGLDAVQSALECACKGIDETGNMVIKVVINIADSQD